MCHQKVLCTLMHGLATKYYPQAWRFWKPSFDHAINKI